MSVMTPTSTTVSALQRLESGVRTLHPGYFALVMGTGILSVGMKAVGAEWISSALLWTAAVCYVVLIALSIWRVVAFRQEILVDLGDPARAFGFFTFVAATDVVGGRLAGEGAFMTAGALLAVGTVTWLLLGYLIPATIVRQQRVQPALQGANGSWFIWVVASQSLAMLAASIEPHFETARRELALVAVFSWSVGLFLYGTVACVVTLRLLLFRPEPKEVTPPYWVTMGATAITVVAGAKIIEMADAPMIDAVRALIAGLTVLFWAFGTWLVPALLATAYWRHVRHKVPLIYEPSLWSIVFPLGMYGVGSAYLGAVDSLPIVEAIGRIEIWLALAAWAIVFVAMLVHLTRFLGGRLGSDQQVQS